MFENKSSKEVLESFSVDEEKGLSLSQVEEIRKASGPNK
ncbi:MAG: hypothetical protein II520_02770, partial [Bacilli bacterium]|nr:hypothetical protein [Bacilli bacterium]